MVGEQVTEGTVVEPDPDSPSRLRGGGLFLRTDDGRMFRLIGGHIPNLAPADFLHTVSRARFQEYLGQKVRVVGYRLHGTIWRAQIVDGE